MLVKNSTKDDQNVFSRNLYMINAYQSDILCVINLNQSEKVDVFIFQNFRISLEAVFN